MMPRHPRARLLAILLVVACSEPASPADMDPGADTGSGGEPGSSTGSSDAASDGSSTAPPATSTDGTGGELTTGGSEAGCGVDPGIEGAVVGAITAQDLERRFLLVLPEGYDPGLAYPLVYMLHGRGSNGEQLRLYAGVEEASAGAAIFVYPDGLPLASMNNQTGWELDAGGRDVAFFDALHEELTTNLCVDPERIYATGHSFGGFFSNTLGCVRGDILRAIAPVAGGGPGAACTGQVAAWIAHGEGDAVVPTLLGEGSRDYWADDNGCSDRTAMTEPDPCVAYSGCDEGLEVTWCLHAESGLGLGTHTWPMFAGAAIWAFFAAH